MWRGFASLWVVMYHGSVIITQKFPSLMRTPVYIFGAYGSLVVQMFFVISGYCIANAASSAMRHDHGFWQFARARVRRIYPAYWFALLIYSLLAIVSSFLVASGHLKSSILGDHDPLHQPWLYFVSNLTLTQSLFKQSYLVGVSWTLCYEIFFYLIIGISLLSSKRRGETAMLNILHLLTASSLLVLVFTPQHRFFPLDMWPQFGLGVLVYDCLKHPSKARPKWWAFVLGLLTLAFVVHGNIPIGTLGEPSRVAFSVALVFAAILLLLYRFDEVLSKNSIVKALSKVGLFSYSLYLMHVICLGLLNQVVKKIHLPEDLSSIWLLLSLLIPIGVARIFYHFCERPFLKGNRAALLEPSERIQKGQVNVFEQADAYRSSGG